MTDLAERALFLERKRNMEVPTKHAMGRVCAVALGLGVIEKGTLYMN